LKLAIENSNVKLWRIEPSEMAWTTRMPNGIVVASPMKMMRAYWNQSSTASRSTP
jgi:hypothetical protein